MKHNSDFKYDLLVGLEYEGKVADMLRNKKVEVKTDFIAHKTGNIAIEFQSRGKPSGISITEADYYVYLIPFAPLSEIMIVAKVSELKKITRIFGKQNGVKTMGDSNTSKSVLIPIKRLFKHED